MRFYLIYAQQNSVKGEKSKLTEMATRSIPPRCTITSDQIY